MKMRAHPILIAFGAILAATSSAQMSALRVPIDATRSKEDVYAATDQAVRTAALNLAKLTQTTRTKKLLANPRLRNVPLSIPMVVHLTRNGQDLTNAAQPMVTRGTPNAITLQFDTSGSGAF